MRSRLMALTAAAVTLFSMVAVYAVEHPDSQRDSIADGCDRAQLGLLGEAILSSRLPGRPTATPSWVYVDGDSRPKTFEGEVLSTHTAGTDLFGVHDTYDLNVDVRPDAAYEHLLSTRNAEEAPPQIHTEWESGLVPSFAWPSPGDRVRETGSEVWDCNHWRDAGRVQGSEYVPGDPLGEAGVEDVEGEEIEIHPIAELATWRARGNFVPNGRVTAVHASQLDVLLSNQGGKAKSIENCSGPVPHEHSGVARRFLADGGCSRLQPIAGRDYTYELKPPQPRPSKRAVLRVQQDVHVANHAPPPIVAVHDDFVKITVPFSRVEPSSDVQEFGATWHAWWTRDAAPTRRYRVTLESVTIVNNLDGDKNDDAMNPSITPAGEWNMFLDVNGNWVNLHDPRPGHTDYVPQLGAVPSALPTPRVFGLGAVTPQVVALDCPTPNELATTGRAAGRAELSLPSVQLARHVTRVTVHPALCVPGGPCPEQFNDPRTCPQSCYAVTYRIEDLTTRQPLTPVNVIGDGTRNHTVYAATTAAKLRWWIDPISRYGHSEEEENAVVADVIDRYLHRSVR